LREIVTSAEARDAIEGWLTGNHHEFSSVEDEAAAFHLDVDYPPRSNKRQRIIQPREFEDMLIFLNGISTAPEHQKQMKEMLPMERDNFFDTLRKQLMFAESSVEWEVNDEGVIEQVQFSFELYFDGLSKTSLFRALLMQHRALLFVITSFNQKFGVPTLDAPPELVSV